MYYKCRRTNPFTSRAKCENVYFYLDRCRIAWNCVVYMLKIVLVVFVLVTILKLDVFWHLYFLTHFVRSSFTVKCDRLKSSPFHKFSWLLIYPNSQRRLISVWIKCSFSYGVQRTVNRRISYNKTRSEIATMTNLEWNLLRDSRNLKQAKYYKFPNPTFWMMIILNKGYAWAFCVSSDRAIGFHFNDIF